MKFTKQDFLQSPQMMINVDEHIKVEENDFLRHSPVRSIPSAHITGTLSYDGKALVTSDLELEGTLIVPDSITDEDLEVEFSTRSQLTYSFEPVNAGEEEITAARKDTVDLNPEIFQAILFEAPMSLTRLPRDQYPEGKGWKLISDQDPKEPAIDPRWEKLNDFKLEDE
ncbi:YceD family protein [Faecalibaculum rodentium]|uniref:YceD family protein n=1 Tax=Faecalibaculum rodentium TaxID=1702221 RepID=UPI0023F42BE3|nr:hypothetical protein [Faecalibaculum rodentium]